MPQLGYFAALPRQDKLRFFSPFWAWIRLELFTGQRSRSGEICHRVFVVVNFIQRAGHEARSFFSSSHDRASSQPHFCLALLWEVSSCLSPPPPPSPPPRQKASIKRGPCIFFSRSRSEDFFSSGSLPWSFDSRNRTVPWQAHGPLVRSLSFTDSTSSGL